MILPDSTERIMSFPGVASWENLCLKVCTVSASYSFSSPSLPANAYCFGSTSEIDKLLNHVKIALASLLENRHNTVVGTRNTGVRLGGKDAVSRRAYMLREQDSQMISNGCE